MTNSSQVRQPSDSAPTISTAAVIGAGTMGRGITLCFANAGIPVTMVDLNETALAQGLEAIRSTYAQMVDKGRISAQDMEQRLGLIGKALRYEALASVDLVVEAVYENLELKQKIFKALDGAVKPSAILATNTSYLDIDAIAAATQRPQQVVGMHFFSPAHIMKLLEVVNGAATSAATLATVTALGERLNKITVVAGNCHGFIGNRMLAAYVHQARLLLLEGALPQQVDMALENFGMAMGPFRMYDVVGIDLEWRARQMAGVTEPDITVWIDDRLCEMGRFGQKTGKGYYRYESGSRTAIHDPSIDALVAEASHVAGIKRRAVTDDSIVKRCMLALINEGARILEEGIARDSGDIDRVYLYGYGFPAARGGPMAYADFLGLNRVLAEIIVLQNNFGERWTPAALLQELAGTSQTFADYRNA